MKKVITLREVRKLFKKELNYRVQSATNKREMKQKYEEIKKMKGRKQLFLTISSVCVAYFSVNEPYDTVICCFLHMDSDK